MTTIGVVVGTFGSEDWMVRGKDVASRIATFWSDPSLVVHCHRDNLAQARNEGVEQLACDYIIICDADDMLDEGYERALIQNIKPGQFLYQPSTLGVTDGIEDDEPHLIEPRDLNVSNFLVIGTAFRKEDFLGFNPGLPALEDWDLFTRMVSKGAKIIQCPDMIYRVTVRTDSRNQNATEHHRAYGIIRNAPHMGKLANYMEGP